MVSFGGRIQFDHLKIAIIQDSPGTGLRSCFSDVLKTQSPDIIAFPEYYFVGPEYLTVPSSLDDRDKFVDILSGWSRDFKCIVVGGTVVEREGTAIHNRCHIFEKGQKIGHYDKIHLFRNEGNGLISPGYEYKVFAFKNFRLGLLICADVLYPDTFANLKGLRPDLVFIPTTSPLRRGETSQEKFGRDNDIFDSGSAYCDSILFKISACGNIMGHPLQGRSLIASPSKIHWRVEPKDEDKPVLIIACLMGEKNNPSLDITVYRS